MSNTDSKTRFAVLHSTTRDLRPVWFARECGSVTSKRRYAWVTSSMAAAEAFVAENGGKVMFVAW